MDRPRKYHKNRKLPKNFYNYFDICTMEGIEKNRAKNAVKVKKVEGIKDLEELRPIEHLFEVFEKPVKNGIVNSYGILRRYYDDWKATGEVPTPPPGRPPKEGYVWFKVRIPEHIKEDFQTVVDNANAMSAIHVTYSDMAAVAFKEFVERRYQFMDSDESDDE